MKRDYRLLGAAILLLIIALMLLSAVLPLHGATPPQSMTVMRFLFFIACSLASLRLLWLFFHDGSL